MMETMPIGRNQYMEKINFVLGNPEILSGISHQKPYEIFAEDTILFLQELFLALRQDTRTKQMPDAAAFGFWCRKASVLEMKKHNVSVSRNRFRLGKGVSLHFVPSNIPVLFGYSMAAALLAGNCVVMRLPSKETMQEEVIVDAVRAVMDKLTQWKSRIILLRSGHDPAVTDALSAICDVRIIWGGDPGIKEIRRSPLPPRATELPFADRSSAAVLDAQTVLETENLTELVKSFYNDTYRNDQNACSSPQLVYWLGREEIVHKAQKRFWDAVFAFARENYELQPAVAVKKWEQAMCLATEDGDLRIETRENLILILQKEKLTSEIWEQAVCGGFFFQASGENLEPLLPVLSRKCQTLTCFGIDKKVLATELFLARITGVDRIVDVGHALDFSLVWDGMDLIGQMSREIYITESSF